MDFPVVVHVRHVRTTGGWKSSGSGGSCWDGIYGFGKIETGWGDGRLALAP